MYNIWSDEELMWLKNNYNNKTIEECIKYLKRTKHSIIGMAHRLKLKQEQYWNTNQINIIKNYYPKGIHECVSRLNRTPNSIIQKALKLGISVEIESKNLNNSISKRKIWDKKKHKIIPALQQYWENNKKANGYKYINSQGYKMIKDNTHPNSDNNGFVREHVYIMSSHLNRKINKNERIHHIDCNKLNNKLNNLFLCSSTREHQLCHTSIYPLIKELLKKEIIGVKNGKYTL